MGVWTKFVAGWYELERKDDGKKFRVYLNRVEARMMFSKYSEFGFESIELEEGQDIPQAHLNRAKVSSSSTK